MIPDEVGHKKIPDDLGQKLIPDELEQEKIPAEVELQMILADFGQEKILADVELQKTLADSELQKILAHFGQEKIPVSELGPEKIPAQFELEIVRLEPGQQSIPNKFGPQLILAESEQQTIATGLEQYPFPTEIWPECLLTKYFRKAPGFLKFQVLLERALDQETALTAAARMRAARVPWMRFRQRVPS